MTKSIRIEFLFLFVFLSFYSANIFGQFDVEYNEINGSLTKTDEFKKELGRYDGYEIPLYEGEAVNLIVYSEKFSPRLIFVTPGGNIYKQASSGTSKIASIISTVNESGNWILYVVGDSAATGDYTFQYSFASKNSLILPVQHDFCTSLQFVVAHAKAYFLLMENPVDAKTAFVKINNAVDAFIDESDGAYTAKMYEGNNLAEAEKIYNQIRGMNPWPGAFTYLEGKILKVLQAKHIIQGSSHESGKVVKTSDEGVLVATGEGHILITEIQLENHKRMSSALFLRGHPLPLDAHFG
jgi:hypothetical protein